MTFYGNYQRITYKCSICGSGSWADVGGAYSDEELTRRTGCNSKQRRHGRQKLCQSCYDGINRIKKDLRSLGYRDVLNDDWECSEKGEYWAVIIWKEPRSEEDEHDGN